MTANVFNQRLVAGANRTRLKVGAEVGFEELACSQNLLVHTLFW